MQQKNSRADNRIATRLITISVEDELTLQLKKSENNLKLNSQEMVRILRGCQFQELEMQL
ncbi:hypothetical protein XBKB1_1880003 [Xenorhabdus bovienii str. kraussei Becker Underwood]|uniref:Uncharacterized protein n=1 Tax=Xenorhabdus bovienii str. kraussei Becker Underwood TaxID=1398204 RepID=A0A077PSM3_XENBV|nr:hypothetical protein XBKB1_1880003 [Xenorhabdus bovienii str. kraussei Becker Underwood]